MGATAEEVKAITAAFGGRGKDSSPRDGYKLRVLLAPGSDVVTAPASPRHHRDRFLGRGHGGWSEMGKYVAVDVRSANSVASSASDDDDDGKGVRLYQSIYETALRNHVPRPVIDDLIRIYSYDIDFQRKVQPGDSFEILYAGEDENPSATPARPKCCSLCLRPAARPESSIATRPPTTTSSTTMTSPARARRNSWCASRCPKETSRPDSAAATIRCSATARCIPAWIGAPPMGTPIFAAGNGIIDKVGWEGGYGKYIRIRHANGYETAYGHMSAFARGMDSGKKVRQGQVIGYVGSTGLSTGAHLHYEILINGRFVDPMKIKLAARPGAGGHVARRLRSGARRLDTMMTRAQRPRATPRPAETREPRSDGRGFRRSDTARRSERIRVTPPPRACR